MTQGQLAEKCFVSTNSVSMWEKGKAYPPKDTMERICVALGVPASYLMAKSAEEDVPEDKRTVYRALLELLREESTDIEPEAKKTL